MKKIDQSTRVNNRAVGPWTYGPNEDGRFMAAAYCSCSRCYMTGYDGDRVEVKAAVRQMVKDCDHIPEPGFEPKPEPEPDSLNPQSSILNLPKTGKVRLS